MARTKKNSDKIDIEKDILAEYGDTIIKRGNQIGSPEVIPTGLLSIDAILGGGVPRGHITEIYGPPSSAKTLLLYRMIAEAQKQGGIAVLIDAERSFEFPWAEVNGVNTEELRIVIPPTGEDAYTILLKYLEAGVDIIGLDSIANTVPSAELVAKMTDANIGLAARMNAKAMRKLTSLQHDAAVILINQTRANVSTMPFVGSPNTTAGGRAIPFYASVRLDLRRIRTIKVAEIPVGAEYRVRVEKAKTGKAKVFRAAQFEVDFDTGADIVKDVLQHGIAKGWATKSGSWFTIGDRREQGEAKIKAYMLEAGLVDEWKEKIINESKDTEEAE